MEPENLEKRKKRRILSKLTLLIGFPLLLLVVILGLLCVPDQFRALSVTDNPYESALPAEASKKIREFASRPDAKESRAGLMEIARGAFPLPDMTGWPAERQKQAIEYQKELCEVQADQLMLPEKTRSLPYAAAYNKMDENLNKLLTIDFKYAELKGQLSKKDQNAISNRNQAIYLATVTQLNIVHGEWIEAAKYNIDDWDKATSYLRRGGIKGRGILIIWSVWRRIHPEYFK